LIIVTNITVSAVSVNP